MVCLRSRGGGCSGLSYVIDLDEVQDGDVVQPSEGFKIVMDRKSSLYLKDVTLHFEGGLQDRGFKFQNPKRFLTVTRIELNLLTRRT